MMVEMDIIIYNASERTYTFKAPYSRNFSFTIFHLEKSRFNSVRGKSPSRVLKYLFYFEILAVHQNDL